MIFISAIAGPYQGAKEIQITKGTILNRIRIDKTRGKIMWVKQVIYFRASALKFKMSMLSNDIIDDQT